MLAAILSAARPLALALLIGAGAFASGPQRAVAQEPPGAIETPDVDVDVEIPDLGTPDLAAPPGADGLPDTKGALVFHGNYCGPGSRGAGLPPIDALDEACMHHDACSPAVGTGLPSCGCNARLTREAARVARSPRASDELRVTAMVVANGAKVLACR